jgi:hypothetical protein
LAEKSFQDAVAFSGIAAIPVISIREVEEVNVPVLGHELLVII